MRSFLYLEGWSQAARMVSAGFTQRECMRYAAFMMRIRKSDDVAAGFFDAVMSGSGL